MCLIEENRLYDITITHNLCFRAKIREKIKTFQLIFVIFYSSKNHLLLHRHELACYRNSHYVNVSVLIIFLQKDNIIKVFYLNYNQFSIKSYVVDVFLNRLAEAILKHIHNIGFYGEILKLISFCHFDTDPRFPPFLAHLSRRLKGELIVYRSIRRPSVRPSVSPSVRP